MLVPKTCKFEIVKIKTKDTLPWARSNMSFLAVCGKYLRQLYNKAEIRTYLRFYAFPEYL